MPPMKVLACRGHVSWGAIGPTYLIGSKKNKVTKVHTLKKRKIMNPNVGMTLVLRPIYFMHPKLES